MKKATGKKSTRPADKEKTELPVCNPPLRTDSALEHESGPMTANTNLEAPSTSVAVTSFTVLGTHLTWLFLGPLTLLLLLMGIVETGAGWLTGLDIAFFVVLALMVFARWADQRSGQGTTITGAPSTPKDFRRYALIVPPLAIGAWIAANAIGNHILNEMQ